MKNRFGLGLILGLTLAGVLTFGWQEWRLSQQRQLSEQQIVKLNQQVENLTKDVESLRSQNAATEQQPKDNFNLQGLILQRGKEVLTSIKNNDMERLASYVHPDKGVRFSPYSHVDSKKDIVLRPNQVKEIPFSQDVHQWGGYDGSGEPIKLTAKEYFKKFVYDRDFLKAEEIGYNQILGHGNTLNNWKDIYPKGEMVEYHFPGFDEKYKGMDWESLRLVFEKKEEAWFLVGILHDQWTI